MSYPSPPPQADPELDEPTFDRMEDLPTELQIKIWKSALPEIRPCAFQYTPGCWEQTLDGDTEFVHHEERIPPIQYCIPSALADGVAFDTTIKWLKKHKFDVKRDPGGAPMWQRSFDPLKDILYFQLPEFVGATQTEWHDLYENLTPDQITLHFSRGLSWMDSSTTRVQAIAVDMMYFMGAWPCIQLYCRMWPSLRTIYAIIGHSVPFHDRPRGMPSRYLPFEAVLRFEAELPDADADGKFVFNAEKIEFEFKGSRRGDQEEFRRLEEALKEDCEAMRDDAVPVTIPTGFIVQPLRFTGIPIDHRYPARYTPSS